MYPWWPQLHSTYHQSQVFSIYYMRFLWVSHFDHKHGCLVEKNVPNRAYFAQLMAGWH